MHECNAKCVNSAITVFLNILGPFWNWKEPQLHCYAVGCVAVECADCTGCAVKLPS